MSGELIPYKGGAMSETLERVGRLASYDTSTREGQRAVFLAVQGADFSLDDMVRQTIEVEHVVCHKTKMVSRETGEVVDCIRTVMIGPDGVRISTFSDTARQDLQRSAEIFMLDLPWKPALKFLVVKQPRKNGPGGYLQLVPELLLDAAKGEK